MKMNPSNFQEIISFSNTRRSKTKCCTDVLIIIDLRKAFEQVRLGTEDQACTD